MKIRLLITSFAVTGCLSLRAQSPITEQQNKPMDSAYVVKIKELTSRLNSRKKLVKDSDEYKLLYNTLWQLELKKQQNPVYKENLKLVTRFEKNLNQELDPFYYSTQYLFFEWIEKNISSTNFRNIDMAKDDWIKLDESNKKMNRENSDYTMYISEMVLTYENFSDIIIAVITDFNAKP